MKGIYQICSIYEKLYLSTRSIMRTIKSDEYLETTLIFKQTYIEKMLIKKQINVDTSREENIEKNYSEIDFAKVKSAKFLKLKYLM